MRGYLVFAPEIIELLDQPAHLIDRDRVSLEHNDIAVGDRSRCCAREIVTSAGVSDDVIVCITEETTHLPEKLKIPVEPPFSLLRRIARSSQKAIVWHAATPHVAIRDYDLEVDIRTDDHSRLNLL